MHGPTELYDVPGHRLAAKARAADFVVCISDFARSQLMGLLDEDGWDRLHVVHCGIDPDEYRPDPAPAGTPRVLCVGRLVPEKGQAVLVDAIARLRERGVPVECTLVGEGPSRPALETAIRARGLDGAVELAGAVSQDEIRAHYAAADVFCLPSFAEGVPVVLMEAMAMEIPVVTTRIAGIPELVADGVDGVLVAPGRPDELADALARLAGAPDERRRLGAAGRRAVLERYDIRAIGPALRALFERHARF
jgi:glycosyltransferase involved in cell wall biosynthesis